MGQVRFVQRGAVEQQLAAGNIVLLTNIGVSSAGELLNCNAFDVRPPAAWPLCARHCLPHATRQPAAAASLAALLRLCWLGPRHMGAAPTTMPAAYPFLQPPLLCSPCPAQVATHAAVELRADKLLVLTGADVRRLDLPHYLPLVSTGSSPS